MDALLSGGACNHHILSAPLPGPAQPSCSTSLSRRDHSRPVCLPLALCGAYRAIMCARRMLLYFEKHPLTFQFCPGHLCCSSRDILQPRIYCLIFSLVGWVGAAGFWRCCTGSPVLPPHGCCVQPCFAYLAILDIFCFLPPPYTELSSAATAVLCVFSCPA